MTATGINVKRGFVYQRQCIILDLFQGLTDAALGKDERLYWLRDKCTNEQMFFPVPLLSVTCIATVRTIHAQ